MAWYPESNVHTLWPKTRSSREFVYADEYWRAHKWYRNGKLHWAYQAGYFDPISERRKIYWTPNVLKVTFQVENAAALVNIESDTPNFKEYQMKDGGSWTAIEKTFTLKLDKPREKHTLRSMNTAGVPGPEYSLVVE